jgi:excisionase family DNA binding protein
MKAAIRVATDPGVPMAIKPRQLVTLCEAAEILAVSVKTVRRYIAAGELDAVRLGRRTIRIKVESLDRLIDGHPVNTWHHRSA